MKAEIYLDKYYNKKKHKVGYKLHIYLFHKQTGEKHLILEKFLTDFEENFLRDLTDADQIENMFQD